MRVSEVWTQQQDLDRENPEGAGRGIVYQERIPFSELILEGFLRREEELCAVPDPERMQLGRKMRQYRRSNRLAMTWGWFIEKMASPRPANESVQEVERECWGIVNAVYTEQITWVGNVLCELARTYYSNSVFRERIFRYFPVYRRILTRTPDYGKWLESRFPDVLAPEWEILAEWLERRRQDASAPDYRASVRALCKKMMSGELKLREIERISALAPYFFPDESSRQILALAMFKGYCLARGDEAEPGYLTLRIAEVLRQLDGLGENVFRIVLQSGRVNDSTGLDERKLEKLYELCENSRKVDLQDMEICLRSCSYTYSWFGGQNLSGYGDIKNFLLCFARCLHFSNREKRDFYEVQMRMLEDAPEEDIRDMQRRGFFPRETLRALIGKLREKRESDRIPLLILWLHGG